MKRKTFYIGLSILICTFIIATAMFFRSRTVSGEYVSSQAVLASPTQHPREISVAPNGIPTPARTTVSSLGGSRRGSLVTIEKAEEAPAWAIPYGEEFWHERSMLVNQQTDAATTNQSSNVDVG